MRTTAARLTLFVVLVALAACITASSVQASSGIRDGIQDDAWLEWGGGTLDHGWNVQAARRAIRPLHAPLESGRLAAAEGSRPHRAIARTTGAGRTEFCADFAATV